MSNKILSKFLNSPISDNYQKSNGLRKMLNSQWENEQNKREFVKKFRSLLKKNNIGSFVIRLNSLILMAVFGVFLHYLYSLEISTNCCQCSVGGWKRDYLKYFSITILLINLLSFFFPDNFYQLVILRSLLIPPFYLAFCIIAILWIRQLREIKCHCSDQWPRALMEGLSILTLIIIVIHLLLITYLRFILK